MAQEGIATLPQSPENQPMAGGDLSSIKQELSQHLPQGAMQAYDQTLDQTLGQLNLAPKELQDLLQALTFILKNPDKYSQIRQQLLQEGVDPSVLPEQFDQGYFTTMLVMVQQGLQGAGAPSQLEAQGFRNGGLAQAAESLRQKGRYGDTVLAHINPQEAMMLKTMGGSGAINPATGLPEFFNPFKEIKNAFSSVGNAVKSVVSSPVGRIVATVALATMLGPGAFGVAGLGLGLPAAAALSAGAISLAGGSNLKIALTSAAIGGAIGYLAPGTSEMLSGIPGLGSGFLNSAATGAVLGAGTAALTGQDIGKSALMGGLAGGAVGYATGQSAFDAAPTTGPAPITDKSTPYNPSGSSSSPTSATDIASQGGSITSGNQGISALSSGTGATNVTASQMGPSYQEMGYTGLGPNQAGPTYQQLGYTGNSPSSFVSSAPLPNSNNFMTTDANSYGDGYGPKGFEGGPGPSVSSPSKGIGDIFTKANAPLLIGGAMALAGGFGSKPTDATPPDLAGAKLRLGGGKSSEDLIRENPDRYLVNTDTRTYDPNVRSTTNVIGDLNAYNPSRFNNQQPGPGNFFGGQPISATAQPQYDFMNSYQPFQPRRYAKGGISQHYPRAKGGVSGPGTGTSDSIPAMLSDGEFVITAKAVKGAGNGSRRSGAKALYRMMHALEKKAGGTV